MYNKYCTNCIITRLWLLNFGLILCQVVNSPQKTSQAEALLLLFDQSRLHVSSSSVAQLPSCDKQRDSPPFSLATSDISTIHNPINIHRAPSFLTSRIVRKLGGCLHHYRCQQLARFRHVLLLLLVCCFLYA